MKNKRYYYWCLQMLIGILIHAQSVTWRQVNGPGTWSHTKFAAATNGVLYSIEQSGSYKTDPTAGMRSQIDTVSYVNTVGLYAGSKSVSP
ncbi:MAG: hypothetical protein IPH18_05345 [Chitinophagaceae bacterium]|nr:hypothetical protein [Chitinophagaceae bacterium]